MLGLFFHAPSADEKGTKVAWAVVWPVLVMGTVRRCSTWCFHLRPRG